MSSLTVTLSNFLETYMLLKDYTYIRGEEILDYAKKDTWKRFHAYRDVHSQILIDECPGDGV